MLPYIPYMDPMGIVKLLSSINGSPVADVPVTGRHSTCHSRTRATWATRHGCRKKGGFFGANDVFLGQMMFFWGKCLTYVFAKT